MSRITSAAPADSRQVPAQAAREPLPPPQARRVHEHPARPAVDVELGDERAHRPHAVPLLVRRHGERRREGGARLLEVVGVDDERLGQLARGAGELAQDQHALLVVPRRDELLGHQVHAVVQAAHVADVGRPVVAEDGRAARGARAGGSPGGSRPARSAR